MYDGRFDVVFQPKISKIGKNLNLSEISRFRSLENCAGLKISQNLRQGPGVMGSMEVRPSTPNCMGYVKIDFLSQKKTDFFSQKTQKFLFAIFSTTNDRRIMKLS